MKRLYSPLLVINTSSSVVLLRWPWEFFYFLSSRFFFSSSYFATCFHFLCDITCRHNCFTVGWSNNRETELNEATWLCCSPSGTMTRIMSHMYLRGVLGLSKCYIIGTESHSNTPSCQTYWLQSRLGRLFYVGMGVKQQGQYFQGLFPKVF